MPSCDVVMSMKKRGGEGGGGRIEGFTRGKEKREKAVKVERQSRRSGTM